MIQKVLICVVIVLAIALQACKEGCTNAGALNYDSEAKGDDGSCMYCDTGWSYISTQNTGAMYDNNPNSAYYGQQVMSASVKNLIQDMRGNACSQLANTSCRAFEHVAELTNYTNQAITFTGDLTVYYNTSDGTQGTTYHFQNINVPPNSSYYTERILHLCYAQASISFDAYISNHYFSYQ